MDNDEYCFIFFNNSIIELEVGIYLANDYQLPYFKNILNLNLLY